MTRILADRDLKTLLGTVIKEADESLLNPNGIELRLGKDVLFHSTGEEMSLEEGSFLKVNPGETVSISSIEKIDFRAEATQNFFPDSMLMGFITPTTTMMREGISQVATKIDAGFMGDLNWGLRNGSVNPLLLRYGEPIFKLTVFMLEADEVPEAPYGEGTNDSYQNTQGITRSKRQIPASIPKNRVVSSSFDKLDPKKQLREAGYPFDFIGTELTSLHGKFEVVSKSVAVLKDDFERRTKELSSKIDGETTTLAAKIEEVRTAILERVEILFDKKLQRVIGVIVGMIPLMYGGVSVLENGFDQRTVGFISALAGIAILVVTYLLTRSNR